MLRLFTHANILQPTHNKRTNNPKNLLISPNQQKPAFTKCLPITSSHRAAVHWMFYSNQMLLRLGEKKWETVKILIQIKPRLEKNEPADWGKRNEGPRLSSNRKKVLKILWVRNWEGKTIRRRCGLITVKRSGRRIITAGPHRRGDESWETEERREEARRKSKPAYRKTLNREAGNKTAE